MRLLTKNALLLFVTTLLVFLAGGFLFYFQLQSIMKEEAIENLYNKKQSIEEYILQHHSLPNTIDKATLFEFKEINKPVPEQLDAVMIYTKGEDETLPYEQLSFPIQLEQQYFQCFLREPVFENDDLIETILTSFAVLASLLTIAFLGINYFFAKRLWRPFFSTLDRIRNYQMEKHKIIPAGKKKTLEFYELDKAIEKMTEKISSDFENLQSFTENASHELQTPLAIIKSQIDVLLQSEKLEEQQTKQLLQINSQISRLAKLNQALLMLCKIENNQFQSSETIDIEPLLIQKIEAIKELADMKEIAIRFSLEKTPVILHPLLAETILNNFLSNALRHTKTKGTIDVKLVGNVLSVSNSGDPLQGEEKKLFERFYKENPDPSSSGLGLAIVKQIADTNGHTVSYEYHDGWHCFFYSFKR